LPPRNDYSRGCNKKVTYVNFCGAKWDILENDKADDGYCNFNTQTISVNKNLHPHRRALSAVHELLHVLFDHVGVDEDEELIKKIEHSVLELIKIFPEKYK